MVRSMTAFSRSSDEQSWGVLVWELRSVNHRYRDVTITLPEALRGLEGALREILAQPLKRGKVECVLRYQPAAHYKEAIQVNEACLEALISTCEQVNEKLSASKTLEPVGLNSVFDVLNWPGVMRTKEADLKPVMQGALDLFETALAALTESRAQEGARLRQGLETRSALMVEIVKRERARRPAILEQARSKVLNKIAALNVEPDGGRLEQELVYLAQKMDVDEELDRLDSHFEALQNSLNSDEPVGRKLDFLMQEFNREANTLGSKSTNIETTNAAIELKVLIEQMREQVQNIE